jgi:predicted nucleotidyltransferase
LKILGIVSEYNPFHNGHKYHLDESVKKVSPDVTICVMSGNFVQRGEPAITSKFIRANIAVENGIDLVFELPVIFSVSTAESFAYSAVKALYHCGITHLSFGCETDNLPLLENIADVLISEPPAYKEALKENLKTGSSFPEARSYAISKILPEGGLVSKTPNNILAIEYLKAIRRLNSSISPVVIKRYGVDYHSLDSYKDISSATGIRNMLKTNIDISRFMPSSSSGLIDKPVFSEDFEKILIYKLRTSTKEDLANIPDVTEGLENRIIKSLHNNNIADILNEIKTKRYPESRIRRILISLLLDIKKEEVNLFKETGYIQYLRLLACSEKGKNFLPDISKSSSVPIVTSVNRFFKNATPLQKDMMLKDILATNIYAIINNDEFNSDFKKDTFENL